MATCRVWPALLMGLLYFHVPLGYPTRPNHYTAIASMHVCMQCSLHCRVDGEPGGSAKLNFSLDHEQLAEINETDVSLLSSWSRMLDVIVLI